MRYPPPLFLIFILFSSLVAHDKPSPFLMDILQEYPSVRDLAIMDSEAYFTVQSPLAEVSVIMVSRKTRNKWRKPNIANFSGRFGDLEPFISTDGLRLYFASNRPLSPDESEVKDYDLWMVLRNDPGSAWSEPVNLGSIVNTEHNEFYPSLTSAGALYFTSDRPDSRGKDNIFYSARDGKGFSPPVSLSDSINTPGYEFNAFIAPDESYLIFSGYNREDGLGSGDLYISFKQADKSWTQAVNMGENINSKQMDYCPFVDVENQTLYFTSRRSDVDFAPGGFMKTELLLKELTKSSNGQSRFYQTHFKLSK